MKIKEIINEETRIWKILPLWARTVLDHVHEIQIKVDMLMVAYEATKVDVAANTAYVKLPKYHVPWGDYKTYSKAAAAFPGEDNEDGTHTVVIAWTEIRKRIKDENYEEYYFNVQDH